ncbi:MAG: hypothetical protein EYC70_12970 [Planctomycetota bacterium]|nr:MAG: hypothetical protein EYC70_12970 [Planctomycetota bacterium]
MAASKERKAEHPAGTSDEAVRRATGRDWSAWGRILDKAGCRTMSHKEIVAVVGEQGTEGWWGQMVTVGYERMRGLREKHQTTAGYQISGSRVIQVPLSRLFQAIADPKLRKKWLAEPIEIRKATRNKSLRMAWADGTAVDVNLYSKGTGKSLVALQHAKLRDAKAAAKMKAFWAGRLDRLRALLED